MTARRRHRARATLEEILAGHAPEMQRIAHALRRLIKEMVPEAREVAYPGWHGIG